jgi:hypothetical protein
MNTQALILIIVGVAFLLLVIPARLLGAVLKIIVMTICVLVGIFLISQGISQLS